jgi:hypothetical protein
MRGVVVGRKERKKEESKKGALTSSYTERVSV